MVLPSLQFDDCYWNIEKVSFVHIVVLPVGDGDEHQPEILGHVYRYGLEVRIGVDFPIVLVHE